MSRPIKFRAWDGELMYTVDTIEFPVGGTKWYGCGVGSGICEANPELSWTVDSVLMQYTGLKDKNGVEIYEGDILTYAGSMQMSEGVCDIEYDEDDGKYVGKRGRLSMRANIGWLAEFGEVIGNIYENPELLGAE